MTKQCNLIVGQKPKPVVTAICFVRILEGLNFELSLNLLADKISGHKTAIVSRKRSANVASK